MTATVQTDTDTAKVMQEYLEQLPPRHLEPLWSRMNMMVPPTPNPVAQPYIWKYSETLPYLQTAGKIVPEEMAERRVLMLVNPNMSESKLPDFSPAAFLHMSSSPSFPHSLPPFPPRRGMPKVG